MIKISQLNTQQIKNIFPMLYMKCFETLSAPKNLPPIMLIAHTDDILYGFSSGFAFNDTIVYVNATGIVPDQRSKRRAIQTQKKIEEVYKSMGFTNILGHVNDKNKKLLMSAMMSGYTITGTMIGIDGKTLLIIDKEL